MSPAEPSLANVTFIELKSNVRIEKMALLIEDYAMIGDCETAALVGRDGSIDWLCWPRFDSAACFAALLGTSDNGRWLLAPTSQPLEVTRRYPRHTHPRDRISHRDRHCGSH
jgi:GH15 family glucan-1,4-alpha-glucosidase